MTGPLCRCGAPLRIRPKGRGRASQGRQPERCAECQRDQARTYQREERRAARAALRYCAAHGVDALAWLDGVERAQEPDEDLT